MGQTVEGFYDLTPREFVFALKDFNDKLFQEYKQRYEVMRLQTVMLINFQCKEGHEITDPKRLIRFSWEMQQQVHIPTRDEWTALDKKYRRN